MFMPSNQEQQDDDAGPAHRAIGPVHGDVVALRLVADGAGPAVQHGEAVRRLHVEPEGDDQPHPEQPQGAGLGQQRIGEHAEELGVAVEALGPEVHLRVADHVHQDEAHEHDSGDGHHPLLAHGRPVEVDHCERAALLASGNRPRRDVGAEF